MLANFCSEILTIPKVTVLGIAEEISELVIDRINYRNKSDSQRPNRPLRQKKNEALYRKLFQGKLDQFSLEVRQQIEPVLLKYAHVFHDEDTNDIKVANVIEHQLPVGDAQPIRRPERGNAEAGAKYA